MSVQRSSFVNDKTPTIAEMACVVERVLRAAGCVVSVQQVRPMSPLTGGGVEITLSVTALNPTGEWLKHFPSRAEGE